jgi:PII-like signaling protein
MENEVKYKTLRIFISSTDQYKFKPLYETIVFEAHRFGMSGATVLKGIMGYGASSEIYNEKFWVLSEKVPLVVEIVDEAKKVDDFIEHILPFMNDIPKGCLITAQNTELVLRKQGGKK